MNILDPKKIKLEKKPDGSIRLTRQDGKTFNDVRFLLLFPFTDLENFVSAIVKKGSEQNEIGMIKHLKELSGGAGKIVRDDLDIRYFVPEIKAIEKITTKYFFHEVDALTDRGKKKFFLGNVRENVRFKADSSIVITDMEKCRYKIPRFDRLSEKSRAELERILMSVSYTHLTLPTNREV